MSAVIYTSFYCSTALSSSPDFSSLLSLSFSTKPPFPLPHTPPDLSLPPHSFTQLFSASTTRRALLPKSWFATKISACTMATGSVQEVLPPTLDSTSDLPAIFDGATRLYISYSCPYAQRVWITRNCKGLQDKIKLVPINLQNRPTWYKEKVYPPNKVPSLEHNKEVKGESLDLLKYIDSSFEGPSLFPSDCAKRQFAEELLSYTDSFNKGVISSFKADGMNDAGEFSLVDIAYAPFIERFQPFLSDVKKYDITAGRPKLAAWIQEMNKNEAYKQTQRDPKEHVETYKKRFLRAQL
ncbi:hypothetical protein Vadar_020208 [Vaccinium darrowii]|uniref:Uncharacterized protein n=1 Tax=Vaccinium darrowii TaxID=229202 RepID=A0ACB7YNL9_9ERIC|nr:hypothetical protein Vadar_020208 [Vaccinium darrowii]